MSEPITVDRETLMRFIEMHISKVDGEWGDCREASSPSLREENRELFEQFGLPWEIERR